MVLSKEEINSREKGPFYNTLSGTIKDFNLRSNILLKNIHTRTSYDIKASTI